MSKLMLHRGGWEANKADLAAVPVPEATDSYVPIPYVRLIEEVELHVPRFGLEIQKEEFALARNGNQLFGVLTVSNGHHGRDYALAIGLRSSYDRSLSVGLVSGHSVFCCDNLAFTGEAKVVRKHTVNVFRDLPDLIYRMLSSVTLMRDRQDVEIAALKEVGLDRTRVNHVVMEAVRAHVVPASHIPKVVLAWEKPQFAEFKPRTGWSLYNAFTSVMKSRSPRAQMEDTLRLSEVFRDALPLSE